MGTEHAEPWTVLRLLQWTTDYFRKHGSTSPRLDAEVLLAEARGSTRIDLYTAFGSEPSDEVREAFRELVRRRAEGTPVAYLVGHKEFYSIDLRVSEATLIPRPETEHLVVEVLDRAKEMLAADPSRNQAAPNQAAPIRIADIGTGCGAIPIAIAKNLPHCALIATDISPAALQIARYNVGRYHLEDRIELREGDLLEPLAGEPPLEILCSNPPYISQEEYEQLAVDVRNFEPRQALVAGAKGTEVIERLLAQVPAKLVPGGCFIFELSPMIAADVVRMANEFGTYQAPKLIKDLAGLPRILSLATKMS